ncbi:39S ribosomal protein L54, mitochondrial [Egretta garzetta]|uniref:39S ribosomal protein L54, mitochondrial n=1 Tax=Egretta garzetta TaxID=188379 RepID=UPI00163B8C1C|nr:39S ribosomal protein L54, mitochondrial [Egretta garzetta]
MLATHAMGVNYLKDGPEVALKPDSEYPDWLFQIHLGPPKKLEELDPDSVEYWRRLRKYNMWQRNRLKKGKKMLARLCELLDNAGRGWRKLAEVAGAEKRFKCSAEELEMCSLKVLEPCGSPTQCLLQLLAERDCTLRYLLGCLERMGHAQACQVLSSGTRVSLTCWAAGPPGLVYQWFCGKREVPGATGPELVIDTAAPPGKPEWYICRVSCGAAFAFSRWAHVQVEKSSSPSSASGYRPTLGGAVSLLPGSPEHSSPGQLYAPPPPVPAATDKVALLIGNMHYLHHKQLKAPMVDVHALSALLRQLDFKVVSLLDLRKAEMQMAVNEFLLLLDKGVYGLLYYAGHGYENFGNSFMVPIDAPSSYTSAHCLCVQRVLRSMQQRRTGLNIFLLDMCRKRNLNDDVIPQVGALQVTANIVFGYATWAKAHVLPESRHLRFDCGVTVQLGFAAEFSNIMIIYTRVVAAPEDIAKCEAKLTDIPEELDVDIKCTNKESPEEVGSPLAPPWSLGCPSCCLYSRLCGLQKLRQELVFTVCLQYRYRGMDDFVEERRTGSVGKPLIAKLNLRLAASPSPPSSPLSASPPASWGAVGSSWVNTPEENLSPEVPGSHAL